MTEDRCRGSDAQIVFLDVIPGFESSNVASHYAGELLRLGNGHAVGPDGIVGWNLLSSDGASNVLVTGEILDGDALDCEG